MKVKVKLDVKVKLKVKVKKVSAVEECSGECSGIGAIHFMRLCGLSYAIFFIHMLQSQILASSNFSNNLNLVPWIGAQPCIQMLLRQFSNMTTYIRVVGKMPD